MTDYTKIDNEVATLDDMRGLVVAYETIASSAMRRIRNFVLENRAFHEGLNRLFQEVVYAYRKEMARLARKRNIQSQKSLSLLRRNGKTVRVLLSANTGLYGEIITKLFARFAAETKEYPGDIVIVGKIGRMLWERAMPGAPFTPLEIRNGETRTASTQYAERNAAPVSGESKSLTGFTPLEIWAVLKRWTRGTPQSSYAPQKLSHSASLTGFTYFDFSDSTVVHKDLQKITQYVSAYERIVVFHGAFRSLLKQDVAASDVSGGGRISTDAGESKVSYLFEPSLEDVAVMFETEIFFSLFEQLFHESRLAKLSSRMVLLDRATANIDRTVKRLSFEHRKLEHRLFNKKQLDAMSGIALWNMAYES